MEAGGAGQAQMAGPRDRACPSTGCTVEQRQTTQHTQLLSWPATQPSNCTVHPQRMTVLYVRVVRVYERRLNMKLFDNVWSQRVAESDVHSGAHFCQSACAVVPSEPQFLGERASQISTDRRRQHGKQGLPNPADPHGGMSRTAVTCSRGDEVDEIMQIFLEGSAGGHLPCEPVNINDPDPLNVGGTTHQFLQPLDVLTGGDDDAVTGQASSSQVPRQDCPSTPTRQRHRRHFQMRRTPTS